jgi:hypothetical protein
MNAALQRTAPAARRIRFINVFMGSTDWTGVERNERRAMSAPTNNSDESVPMLDTEPRHFMERRRYAVHAAPVVIHLCHKPCRLNFVDLQKTALDLSIATSQHPTKFDDKV